MAHVDNPINTKFTELLRKKGGEKILKTMRSILKDRTIITEVWGHNNFLVNEATIKQLSKLDEAGWSGVVDRQRSRSFLKKGASPEELEIIKEVVTIVAGKARR